MRRHLLGLLAFFVLLIFSSSLKSQTTLITGDIAITGYNADTPDQFTFVLIKDVVANTMITYTDNGWLAAGGFRTGEGVSNLTFTSAATAGTEFKVEGTTVTSSTAATATVSNVSGSIAFSGSGDQLFIYQGAAPVTGFECNFITGIHSNSSGGWEADATSSNSSALPGAFTDGTNALALVPEVDNGFYNRTSLTGSSAVLVSNIYTLTDWTTSNTTQTLTATGGYNITSIDALAAADTPTLGGTASICPGSDGMVTVTAGNLNDASAWVLFTGSCGGSEVDRNATGMFTVSPASTTEYFVAGETCDGLGMCGSFTVNIDNVPPVITIPADMTLSSCDSTDPSDSGMATATDDCATAPIVTPWINEIHYDDAGGDAMEGIEIAGPAGTDFTGWSIELYNGNNNSLYDTELLSGVLNNDTNGYGFLNVPISGIQNGVSDGIALIDNNGVVVQFLSYEGVLTPIDGAASGMTSVDIGVAESNSAAEGSSLQLEGTGGQYSEFTWSTTPDLPNTFGAVNTGQTFVAPTGGTVTIVFADAITPGACAGESTIERTWTATDNNGNQDVDTQTIVIEDNDAPIIITPGDITIACTQTDFSPAATGGVATAYDPCVGAQPSITPFINEVHYDNGGTDMGEFIEIAGLANQTLAGWSLVLYNGANGTIYNTVAVDGTFANPGSGFGFITINFPSNGIQNGAPDGIALVDDAGAVVEFISYEGSFTPAAGPAAGMMSTDIGIEESFMTPLGFSVQRTGAGATGTDFTWTGPLAESPGAVNAGQSSTVVGPIATSFTEVTSADGRTITRTFSATDDCGNMTVDGDYVQVITIGDVAPRLECRQPTSTCNAPGLCGSDQITLLPPFIFDDCGFGDPVTITSDQPAFFPVGTTVVTWTVANSTGTSQCESLVIITDEEAPMVECPSDGVVNIYTQNPNSCTGQINLNPVITDNCGVTSITGTGNFTFTPGLYNRPVTATDAAGNSTTCDYQIFVHDTFSPELTNCPDDLTVTATGDLTTVFLPQPSASDNCGSVEITNDAPEDGFPIGTTTVTFMLNDAYGNWVACYYDVIVNAPIVFAGLNDVEASLEEEEATARVAWNEPAANTSCEICAETEIDDYRYLGVYRGHQYFLYEGESTTWADAELMAETLDAQLVTINTESENRFLKNALNEDFSSAFTGLTQTIVDEEIVMNWLTTENVDFINFDAEYIPTEEANIALMQADGTWILVDNTVESAFLIERPCINFEQISPVLTETDEETGEIISETLLTCGSDFTEGTYVVTYRATDMCGNEAEINFDVIVEMPTANTCTTGGTESSVYIENILMGEYEMETGDDEGFGDYTEEEMVLYAVIDEETEEFTPVPMNIAVGGVNGTEELFYRVWLDKNHDGDFFDADEMLAETMTTEDWNLELPAFEENMDATRMRIMVSKHDYPEVCGEVAQGEAEDYTVSILQTIVRPDGDDDIRGDDNDAPIVIGGNNDSPYTGILDLFPNPAKGEVNLNLKGFIGQNADLTLTNQLGQVVYIQKLTDIQNSRLTLDVSNFATGIYGVSVLTEGGEMQTVKLIVE